jgi:hypothetical protein
MTYSLFELHLHAISVVTDCLVNFGTGESFPPTLVSLRSRSIRLLYEHVYLYRLQMLEVVTLIMAASLESLWLIQYEFLNITFERRYFGIFLRVAKRITVEKKY